MPGLDIDITADTDTAALDRLIERLAIATEQANRLADALRNSATSSSATGGGSGGGGGGTSTPPPIHRTLTLPPIHRTLTLPRIHPILIRTRLPHRVMGEEPAEPSGISVATLPAASPS
jgi:hypothetical protein